MIKNEKNLPPTFKRKFPRRKFTSFIGVLYLGVYRLCQGAVLGEGGLAFYFEQEIPISGLVVVSFRIPGDAIVSIRGEVRNIKKDKSSKLFFHGLQFFSLPLEERRKIRSYVSARLQEEELV